MSMTRAVKSGNRVKQPRVLAGRDMLNDCLHSRFIPLMRSGLSVLSTLNLVMPILVSIIPNAYILTLPGLKLLGFKEKSQIAFGDNVKHALFIYPDELVNGSRLRASFLV